MSKRALIAIIAAGCGRLAFDSEHHQDASPSVDAVACVGDLLIDTAADDPGQACQGPGCSLRAALALANTRSSTTICIAGTVPTITTATALGVTSDVTIIGPGAICGSGADRVFDVATGGALRLRDLTVCHGRFTDENGAGVRVADGATLDADGVLFDDNIVASNLAYTEGGAVRADGDATIQLRRSRFTHNQALQIASATGYGRGGAFAIEAGPNARVLIQDTAFEDNLSTNVGGALFLAMDGAGLTIERALFARNQSDTGAAIDINCASTGTIAVSNSTFADNVPLGGAVIYVCGAETFRSSFCSLRGNAGELVQVDLATSAVQWEASAIAAGTFDLCGGPGTHSSLDHNVVDHTGAGCTLTASHDQAVDPLLAPLASNGGPTQTLALPAGSPAIDGAGPVCPAIDQRGLPRPAKAACDEGAFEAQ